MLSRDLRHDDMSLQFSEKNKEILKAFESLNTSKVKKIDQPYKELVLPEQKARVDHKNSDLSHKAIDSVKIKFKKPIQLKKCFEVVAGHSNKLFSLDNGKKILKYSNENEREFYLNQNDGKDKRLSQIIPKTYRSTNIDVKSVIMENMLYGLNEPKVLDLKMGETIVCRSILKKQGYNFLYRLHQKLWNNFKYWITGGKKRGWCVDGGTGIPGSKFSKSLHSQNHFNEYLAKNISKSQIAQLLEELKKIKDITATSDYAFIDSSILIISDKDIIKTKLIDFASVLNKAQDNTKGNEEFIKYQKFFQKSINNLIEEVSHYAHSQQSSL